MTEEPEQDSTQETSATRGGPGCGSIVFTLLVLLILAATIYYWPARRLAAASKQFDAVATAKAPQRVAEAAFMKGHLVLAVGIRGANVEVIAYNRKPIPQQIAELGVRALGFNPSDLQQVGRINYVSGIFDRSVNLVTGERLTSTTVAGKP